MEYRVTKAFGEYKPGQIVRDDKRYIRRKLQEGGCLEKMEAVVKNKMQPDAKNKGVK